MSIDPPYDPRAFANLLLDCVPEYVASPTNLALQKLLYFAHAIFLIGSNAPLLAGHFEAWRYGPVSPVAYRAFKDAGDRPINFRACRTNVLTGEVSVITSPTSAHIRQLALHVMTSYGRMTPGRLVEISHARNAPWDYIVAKSKSSVTLGLRIPDALIKERFKYHKVAVEESPKLGEPSEDSPFA
jgi:uncharacterized phage-associated protein